ncbi:MAG: bifunctional 4-hydroxy-2-oxoglutarate aldolase/2-dehydro-3-deoxy-phosphogluconate aldolase [Armatimonadota bacterium]
MDQILKSIEEYGIVPVVVIDNADDAVPLCKALADGGLPLAEITFRTAAAEQAIKNVAKELPNVLVGAGTVLTTDQAQRAIDAGAKFIVSPGFDPVVVKYCLDKGVPITPGCSNPTDLAAAVSFGLEVVKFFPAEALGGLDMLKAMAAPYGGLKFIPTGGVSTSNLNDYLSFNKILACGGTWIAKADAIKAGKFDEITKITSEAVATMLGFKLAHVGINTPNDDAALSTANTLANLFFMPVKEGNSSNFAGSAFEVMKSPGLGANGHIAIETSNIKRAIAYFERIGVPVDMSTAKGDPMIAVYLKDEVAGFAFHLLQKK